MKHLHTSLLSRFALLAIAGLGLTEVASAVLVQAVGVTLGPGNTDNVVLDDGTHGIENLSDLSGIIGSADPGFELTVDSIHAAYNSANGGRALNTGGTVVLDFDLGGTFDLTGVALWNGNEDDRPGNGRTFDQRDRTRRGVGSAVISTSVDGTTFTEQGTFAFTQESFVPDPENPDVIATSDVNAQLANFLSTIVGVSTVRFAASNTTVGGDGAVDTIVNFNEIAFITAPAVVIPEPTSMLALGMIGFAGAFGSRRRRTARI